MGKLIYSLSVSLDGFIETPDRKLDWVIVDEEFHTFANDESREMDAFLYGRRFYELMASFWPSADTDPAAPAYIVDFARIWREKPKIVFSKTLDEVKWNSRLVREDPGAEAARLKAQFGKDLAVGGASLAASLIRLGLVDEYRLYVQPVILGSGRRFFPNLDRRIDLRLVDRLPFASGVIFLRYQVEDRST